VHPILLPVIVARWFEGGAGYAYSKDVDAGLLTATISALAPVNRQETEHSFCLTLPDGRLLIGARVRDERALDPDSAQRHPYVIRAAVCPPELSRRQRDEVARQVTGLAVPLRPGLAADLFVQLLPPSELPPVPHQGRGGGGARLWLLVIVAVAADAALLGLDWSTGAGGFAVRAAVLIGLAWALGRRWAVSESEELARVEWEWYADAEPGAAAVAIEAGAKLILPGGVALVPRGGEPLRALGVQRVQASSVIYWTVVVRPDVAILTGQESILLDGSPCGVVFTRVYVRDSGVWRLASAQWAPYAGA
jgi:hypothetical protein